MSDARSELQDLARVFKVSKPVFTLRLANEDTRVCSQLKEKYDPFVDARLDPDPVVMILAGNYRENYVKSSRKMVANINIDETYSSIMRKIIEFYHIKSPLKSPGNSHLAKWLRSVQNRINEPYSKPVLNLYRYMHSIQHKPKNDPNVLNVLAILQLMMEKYERN